MVMSRPNPLNTPEIPNSWGRLQLLFANGLSAIAESLHASQDRFAPRPPKEIHRCIARSPENSPKKNYADFGGGTHKGKPVPGMLLPGMRKGNTPVGSDRGPGNYTDANSPQPGSTLAD